MRKTLIIINVANSQVIGNQMIGGIRDLKAKQISIMMAWTYFLIQMYNLIVLLRILIGELLRLRRAIIWTEKNYVT